MKNLVKPNLNFDYRSGKHRNECNRHARTVTGTADVTGSTISAGVQNIDSFTKDQVITLLTDANGITGLDGVQFGTLTDAGFAETGFYLTKASDGNSVLLTIGTKPADSGSEDTPDTTGNNVEITSAGSTTTYGDYRRPTWQPRIPTLSP